MSEASLPRPQPGDVVLGCVHRPSPFQAHVFHAATGVGFMRPNGTHGTATWILLCDHCNAECLMKGGDPLDMDLGCDLKWTEQMGALRYKETS